MTTRVVYSLFDNNPNICTECHRALPKGYFLTFRSPKLKPGFVKDESNIKMKIYGLLYTYSAKDAENPFPLAACVLTAKAKPT